MWPSFVHWQERLPASALPAVKLLGPAQSAKTPTNVPPKGVSASSAATSELDDQVATQMRLNLLQTSASGYVSARSPFAHHPALTLRL
jgi:hypothetical protein